MDTKETENQEQRKTKRLVGVQFSSAGKVHSFSAEDYTILPHDLVVVEGDKGPIIGRVTTPVYEQDAKEVPTNIRKVLRQVEEKDIERYNKNREEAMQSFNLCQEKISEHGLSMKLVDVDVLTGDTKAIFYFTAEERVDFRSLVKDLATSLHMRIEMRQIGARDAAKSIGGIGSCGLVCCCESHLREFQSVAIQMAKNQGLSPNPAKLTGQCGKLKCCLLYENKMYVHEKKTLPGPGSEVDTPNGKGKVNSLDVPRRLVNVYLEESGKELRFKEEDIEVLKRRDSKNREKRDKREPKKPRPKKK